MTDPRVTHVYEIDHTRDHNRISVKVERSAALSADLTTVIERSDGRIHLITKDQYPTSDQHASFGLSWEEAERLGNALLRAVDDVEAAAKVNATLVNAPAEDETTPAYLQARRGSESEGAETDE